MRRANVPVTGTLSGAERADLPALGLRL